MTKHMHVYSLYTNLAGDAWDTSNHQQRSPAWNPSTTKKIHENKRMEQDFSQGAVPSIIQ